MAEEFPQNFRPGRSGRPTTKVELAVSCRNLLDRDVLSLSDPFCVLYVKEFGSKDWTEFGRTEVVKDTLNPDFVNKFVLGYFFEEAQKLKFEIYDEDAPCPDLKKHDFLGSMQCTLSEIIGSTHEKLTRRLQGPNAKAGEITVSSEEITRCKDEVTLQFCASNLEKKDLLGKSDPFLEFSRANEDQSFTVVHRTEYIMKTLQPTWKKFTIPLRTLCNADVDRSLKVECIDWNRSGRHSPIGAFSTTVRELEKGPGSHNEYQCVHSDKKKKQKESGIVKLMHYSIEKVDSFLDYIKGGTQISCMVAIDFTASNGDPTSPRSLHYSRDPQTPNLYARALQAVGEILQEYDSDQLIPAFGFGARVPPDGRLSHEFFLNGDDSNPDCQGIDGVLEAYYKALKTVELYGPTNFAPIINHVARIASKTTGSPGDNYFILLMLTDGVITDMPQTCEAIVNASSLPISIIIVGIGDTDFSEMGTLDGDDVRVSFKDRCAERDIVQFVAFRDFISNDLDRSQVVLAKEVLAEIPDQFMSYMKSRGIRPKPPYNRSRHSERSA